MSFFLGIRWFEEERRYNNSLIFSSIFFNLLFDRGLVVFNLGLDTLLLSLSRFVSFAICNLLLVLSFVCMIDFC